MTEDIPIEEWWENADSRRAYTYQEKKLNRLSDYELFLENHGEETDPRKLATFMEEEHGIKLSERRLKRIVKELDKKANKENYEKILAEDNAMNIFTLTTTLRDYAPIKPTNAEAYVLALHYLHTWFTQTKKLIDEDKLQRGGELDFYDSDTMNNLIADMHDNWRRYMDNAARVREQINRINAECLKELRETRENA